ncbi:NADH-quinone oxidoreductase subunit J [Buchnera aphidicola (Cinara kochiana kochiana)]|uniref:NADH-quinone oxidoreductase subunit J n=1 Tax=Buchnera aphidicola (Cinara kochiana kochiana) TaxID=2518976 RepID=A0A451D597_9GAMM|nr:NADH-quinone oxidoreductase subunit J [Buchnera aphidicola]VFP81030.1 NADH-quinone oxidoreductase subunit J [Buchnera aphidicola (Cinara kochiana kochiana)]
MIFVFYLFSLLSVIFSLLIVISRNSVYSLLYLISLICSISGIFFTLGMIFIGALEVIIYAGAIMVLFVFSVMLINNNLFQKCNRLNRSINFYEILSFICLIVILLILSIQFIKEKNKILIFNDIAMKQISMCLFNKYGFLVEFTSLLLLSALLVVCILFK